MGEYDGINEREEGRKKMPLGMVVLFMGLIITGLLYLILYLPQITGWTQAGQYEKQVKAKEAVLSGLVKTDIHDETEHDQMMAADKGKEIYDAECSACHGEKLEGGAGPALSGPAFRFGKTLADHIRVISKGTANGMPGFEKQLGAEKIKQVASYIHTRHQH